MNTPRSRSCLASDSGRTSAVTSCPRSDSARATAPPTYPVAPVRNTRIVTPRPRDPETLLLLLHRLAECQGHRALPLRRGLAALLGKFRELVALERRFRRLVAQ